MTYKVFLWHFNDNQDAFVEIVFDIQPTGPNDTSGYKYFCETIGLELNGQQWHSVNYYEENYCDKDLEAKYQFKGVFKDLDFAIAHSWDLLRIIKEKL